MSEQFIERRFRMWLNEQGDNLVMTPREQQLLADAFFAGAKAVLFTDNGKQRTISQMRDIDNELKAHQPEHRPK